jgi:NAD(P)-dependent dehydrogenase (short-subunit alcohol dehydrogenase family)
MSFDFTGKVVLVTGSSSGIGAATTLLFSKCGAQVVVTGRNQQNISRVAKECAEVSPKRLKPLEVVADVCKEDDCKRLIASTVKKFGKLDILVNNAGATNKPSNVYDDNYLENYKWNLSTNLDSAVYMTHYSVTHLEKTKGIIINISSIKSAQTVCL